MCGVACRDILLMLLSVAALALSQVVENLLLMLLLMLVVSNGSTDGRVEKSARSIADCNV